MWKDNDIKTVMYIVKGKHAFIYIEHISVQDKYERHLKERIFLRILLEFVTIQLQLVIQSTRESNKII